VALYKAIGGGWEFENLNQTNHPQDGIAVLAK
jgi:hypothetical protein